MNPPKSVFQPSAFVAASSSTYTRKNKFLSWIYSVASRIPVNSNRTVALMNQIIRNEVTDIPFVLSSSQGREYVATYVTRLGPSNYLHSSYKLL
jgi:hypothetical protein